MKALRKIIRKSLGVEVRSYILRGVCEIEPVNKWISERKKYTEPID
jgi:hypothetical protein